MNQKLLDLVERLRQAGQVTRQTLVKFNYGGASPWDHNSAVDMAAKELKTEIEWIGISPDLRAKLESTPVLTESDLKELGDAVKEALDETNNSKRHNN